MTVPALLVLEDGRTFRGQAYGAVGEPANVVLVDPGASWTVDPRASASRSRNTPFAGRELPSRVVATFLRGTPTVLDGAPAPREP